MAFFKTMLLQKNLTSSVDCQCIALDFRGHGNTQTEDDLDLSADTLARLEKKLCGGLRCFNKNDPDVAMTHTTKTSSRLKLLCLLTSCFSLQIEAVFLKDLF